MKTNRFFTSMCLAIILLAFSNFSTSGVKSSNFTVSLSTLPVRGDTEYDLIVSYAPGNNAYTLTPYTGFYILGNSGKDVTPNQPTVFRIKTYPRVFHIAGVVNAITCAPSCSQSGYQYFGF